jgi:16S rRNA (guanine966-N2)-methyltransferase
MIPAVARQPRELPARAARNSVRIIGGTWRGRRLHFPDVPDLRPTPDRVRETLFNWLQHEITGSRCLDLFAGSGALGVEALSRGATQVVFVESAAAAALCLKRELDALGAGTAALVQNSSAERFLAGSTQAFDIVFLDPPFKSEALTALCLNINERGSVKSGGLAYLECAAGTKLDLPEGWEMLKSKSAGEVGYHLARVNRRIRQ